MTDFCLSLLTAGIREMFNRCDFYEKVDQNIIYVSVHDAVQAALYEQRMRNKLKVSIEQSMVKHVFYVSSDNKHVSAR